MMSAMIDESAPNLPRKVPESLPSVGSFQQCDTTSPWGFLCFATRSLRTLYEQSHPNPQHAA
jgi:hypothetical protein